MSTQLMNQVRAGAAAVLALSSFLALPSHAASYCNNYAATVQGPGAPALSPVGNAVLGVADMKFGGLNADNCYGVAAGNDSKNALNLLGAFGQSNWTDVVKADVVDGFSSASDTGTFGGYGFLLTTTVGKTGTWTLEVTSGTPLPAYFDIVGALKGGTGYALYLFDDQKVEATNSGSWTITFDNNGGNIPDLSHLSIYMRAGEVPNGGGGGGGSAPEPGSIALLGLGLLGMAVVRRRKS